MSKRRRIGIALLLVFFCIIWWRVIFYNQKTGFEEVAVEDSQTSFTASFDTVHYIVVANDDTALKNRLENEAASVHITIADAAGNTVGECNTDSINIHTNGFTSTESSQFSGLPVQLTAGQNYNLFYQAILSDGTKLDHLSFMMYGNSVSTNRESACIFALIALLILICLTDTSMSLKKYGVIWIAMVIMAMVMMPLLQSSDEMQAFGDAYGYSSNLLGKAAGDSDENVYIDESGLQNNGYLSYSVPLMRFWSDRHYGNERENTVVTSLYQMSGRKCSLITVPEILAVTAARAWKLPYQMILVSGWIMNAFLTGILMMFALKLLSEHEIAQKYLMFIAVVPAMLIAAMSYTGLGILISLCALYWTFCYRIVKADDISRKKYEIFAAVLLLLIISVQYAYCVLGIILYRAIADKKGKVAVTGAVLAETFLCMGYRQLQLLHVPAAVSLLSSSPAQYTGAILNTVFDRTDGIINELIAYHYYSHEEMVIVVYLTLTVIVMMHMAFTEECTNGVPLSHNLFDIGAVAAWMVGCLLLMSSGPITISEGMKYGIFAGMTGEMLIPFLFLPGVRLQGVLSGMTGGRMKLMRNLVIASSCIIIMIRMGKL